MNPYLRIGYAIGTEEALQLADRLAAWHDAMVAHERRTGAGCDDECPHVEASALWGEAQEVFGPAAGDLRFLAACAARTVSADRRVGAGA